MNILPRSTLYNLEPMEIGTEFTECLTNYLSRLALAHDSTVGMLLKNCIWPFVQNCDEEAKARKIYPGLGGKDRWSMTSEYWLMNGIQTPAAQWTQLIQDMTKRNDLSHLTMLPWKGTISGTGLMRKNLYFCALCLQAQRQQIEYPNIPLLWCLSAVKICPKHMVYLEDRCLNCLESVSIICTVYRPGFCPKCGEFIGSITHNNLALKHTEKSSKDYWMTAHFSELIKHNGNLAATTSTTTDNRRFFLIFQSDDRRRAKHIGFLARSLKISRGSIETWRNGHALPFESFLNMSYESNLSPFHTYKFPNVKIVHNMKTLITEFNENSQELDKKIQELLKTTKSITGLCSALGISQQTLKKWHPECYQHFKTLVNQNQETMILGCLNELKAALDNPLNFPSIRDIARRLGVKPAFLNEIAPDLLKTIIQKRSESAKKRRTEKIIRCQTTVIDCAKRLSEIGIPLTTKTVERYLNQPGILRIPDVRKVLDDYLSQIAEGKI